MITILTLIALLILSYGITYCFTMLFFWIDLEINNPDTSEQIDSIRSRHLKMNKYLNLAIFIGLCIFVFFK